MLTKTQNQLPRFRLENNCLTEIIIWPQAKDFIRATLVTLQSVQNVAEAIL